MKMLQIYVTLPLKSVCFFKGAQIQHGTVIIVFLIFVCLYIAVKVG